MRCVAWNPGGRIKHWGSVIFQFRIVGVHHQRVRRYASNLGAQCLGARLTNPRAGEETLHKLCLISPAGGFSALQNLFWCITELNLPYTPAYSSSHTWRRLPFAWSSTTSRLTFCQLSPRPSPADVRSSIPIYIDRFSHPGRILKTRSQAVVLRCGP